MKGNVSKGPVLLHYSLLALFPLTKSHKAAECKNKLENKIQLNIPSNFCVVLFSVILFWLFKNVFLCHLRVTLSLTLLSIAACLGSRSCPFSEVTWQLLCKAGMDKPCLWQALHIIVNPITAAPQASSMGENIPKYENSYKKSHQWKCLETVLLVYIPLILCKQFIIYLSSSFPPISFDVWNERECCHPCRLPSDSALLHSGQIPQIGFQLLVTCVFLAFWLLFHQAISYMDMTGLVKTKLSIEPACPLIGLLLEDLIIPEWSYIIIGQCNFCDSSPTRPFIWKGNGNLIHMT